MMSEELNKIRVIFVDDEAKILSGLRRMLRSVRNEWDIAFANSGDEALEILSAGEFDVIVSDIRMPKMNGVELLEQVRKRYPHIIRIILSGQASRGTVIQAVGPTHQYLPKPCDGDTLKATIGRINKLREILAVEKLRGVIAALESLPSLPLLYDELEKELLSPEASLRTVGEIISKDVGMSGKILQLVNSGIFGEPQRFTSPAKAVAALGLDIIKPLTLSLHIFLRFKEDRLQACPIEAVWSHSLIVAAVSRQIAQSQQADDKLCNLAFQAGLLHDIGKIVLAQQLPDDYSGVIQQVNRNGGNLLDAERAVFTVTHAEVGAYLLGIWGLQNAVIEALAYHHCPGSSARGAEFSALTAVHVSNALACENDPDDHNIATGAIDMDYLTDLGLVDRLPDWSELYRRVANKEMANV